MATRFAEALKNFKFPKEIKSDLIYCQRALRSHLKVHQMIVDQFLKDRELSSSKQSCLEELENEIYEINCEQQYLLLRVRRIVDEFFKSLRREDIGVDRVMMNDYISRQVVPFIQNKEYVCVPTLVRPRFNETQLLNSFFTPGKVKLEKSPPPPAAVEVQQTSPELPFNGAKQVSLLKPISERVVVSPLVRQKSVPEIIIPDDDKPAPALEPELPVSSKVKLSRLNLRQALSKAAAARSIAAPQPAAVAAAPVAALNVPQPKVVKVVETQVKKPQVKPFKSDPSSSDDSLEARVPSPPQLDMKTKPDDYNQEAFLRLFNLFSQEQIQLMQQRRSKRKRRSVHNNEKADFHYGRIDHMLSPQPNASKKRKKEFLLSPRVNRALKKKRSTDTDRSNSSSPDEKAVCSECLQRGGVVIQCKECPNTFHDKCQKDANIKPVPGQCPSCTRKQLANQQQEEAARRKNSAVLEEKIRDLESQYAVEEKRRKLLQAEGNMYKIGMRNLIDIVQKIKNDNDK